MIVLILLFILLIVLVNSINSNSNTNTNLYNDNNDNNDDTIIASYHRQTTSTQHSSITNNFNNKVHPFKRSSGSSEKNIPGIFLLGVQKGGSSSLYEFLIKHPLLCGGTKKDPHFFDHYYKKGRSHYEGYYTDPKCKEHHLSMYIDGSSMMHNMDIIAPRIIEFYTEEERKLLKFIVLLREPVTRDYSWYENLTKRDLAEGKKFGNIKTFKEIDEGYVKANRTTHRTGRYVTQLSQFIQYFNRSQILLLNSDSLFTNSSQHMESIRNFLNVHDYEPWTESIFPNESPIAYSSQLGLLDCITKHIPALDCDFRDLLGQYYHPYNKNLENWIEKTPNKSDQEPFFVSFGEDHKKISCVHDARELFEKLLKKDKQNSCFGKY